MRGYAKLPVTEPVEAGFTEVKVISISGERVDVDDTQVDPDDALHITVGLRSLADGVYTVSWQALSVVDGHITLGTFPFAVGSVDPAALAAAGGASTSVVSANPGEIIPRWLTIIGAALVIGGYVFRSYVWKPVWREIHPEVETSVIEVRFDQLHQLGVIIFLSSSLAALFWHIQVATSLPPWFAVLDFSMTELVFGSRYGLLWLSRIGFMTILLVVDGYRQPWLQYFRPIAIAGVLLTISLNNHAAAVPKPFLPVLSIWLHLVMATVWIGGLAHLAVGLFGIRTQAKSDRTRIAAALVPRFSNVGLVTVGTLTLTGIYNAVITVASFDALFNSDYGRALLIKLALLAPLIALAAVNLTILRPLLQTAVESGSESNLLLQLRRTVSGELVLGTALLLVASMFASPPPAESLGGRLAFTERAEDLSLALKVTPGSIGFNAFELNVRDEDRQPVSDATDVELRFSPLSGELAPSTLALEPAGAGLYRADGGNLSQQGEWQIQAVVRRTGEFDAFANYAVALAAPGQTRAVSNRPQLFRYAAAIVYAVAVLYLLAMFALLSTRVRRFTFGVLPALGLALTSIGVGRTGTAIAEAALGGVNPFPPSQESLAIGKDIYEQNCLVCHGVIGLGDGPAGLLLNPPPADMQVHMIPGLHTDGQIYEWITDGYPNSPMPAFSDLLTEEERWHLLNYIRTLVPEDVQ